MVQLWLSQRNADPKLARLLKKMKFDGKNLVKEVDVIKKELSKSKFKFSKMKVAWLKKEINLLKDICNKAKNKGIYTE